ncbi:MAG: N-acyl homoserine lactonase family protein [Gammaproteobacteria bacterium]
MKRLIILFSIFTLFVFNCSYAQVQDKPPTQIKLYAIDCGRIDVSNFAGFSDTGDYDNKSVRLADPCFLIVHSKGILLWDTGLPDSMIKKPVSVAVYQFTKSTSIADSLKKINLTPNDITYVAVSHSHLDHMGALDQFPKSKWILSEAELKYAKTHPSPFVIDASSLKSWKTAGKIMIGSDYDVFGDGTVQILNTPGHTPGHLSLMIKLPQTGVVILSGDEFHQRSSVEPLRVPAFNTSRAETMASADRIKRLIKNTNARLIVQHDINESPKFPNYLD